MKCCENLCCTEIENLTVKTHDLTILENINLHLHCGELTAVIGPNGAGKSTLLKSIIGEVKHSGTVKFRSENGVTTPVIGYVPQNISFDYDSPATVTDLFYSCVGKKIDVKKALEVTNASDLCERKLARLSGGELQRVLLGLALNPVPNLLLLDEPISGVDHAGIELFWAILTSIRKKYDMTVIIISHNLSQVKAYADRTVLLNKKILASGTPKEVFQSDEFESIFGVD